VSLLVPSLLKRVLPDRLKTLHQSVLQYHTHAVVTYTLARLVTIEDTTGVKYIGSTDLAAAVDAIARMEISSVGAVHQRTRPKYSKFLIAFSMTQNNDTIRPTRHHITV